MKEQILKLRKEGNSYETIAKIVPCALSTVWYYCTDGAKKKRVDNKPKGVQKLRIEIKQHFGGKCLICGYNRCIDALEFHHKDGSEKSENVGTLISQFSKLKAYKEAEKCVLICANCHRELHAGIVALPN